MNTLSERRRSKLLKSAARRSNDGQALALCEAYREALWDIDIKIRAQLRKDGSWK